MSYHQISIREAVHRLNQPQGGWFLPQVQRQYVWGQRSEAETYICSLMDSIYRGYPIGQLVLWETKLDIPHREFLRDYAPGKIAPITEKGIWGRHKFLVYDGQQRLQTLYSVLQHQFNHRVLCFDLSFDRQRAETDASKSDETGFHFIDADTQPALGIIKMNTLFNTDEDSEEKVALETAHTANCSSDAARCLRIKANIDRLWDAFVKTDHKLLSYFSIRSKSDVPVNEIFERLNTGGIALTQAELALGTIKRDFPRFEEQLYTLSDEVTAETQGYVFAPSEILQFLYFLLFGTPSVRSDNVANTKSFNDAWNDAREPLKDFFRGFFWTLLKINSSAIVPRKLCLLPLLAYNHHLQKNHERKTHQLSDEIIKSMKQFLILSQVNDWNTQTMVGDFAEIAEKAGRNGRPLPIEDIRARVKNRETSLSEENLVWQRWFALKIMTPSRVYSFAGPTPQVDHIFPKSRGDKEYRQRVDTLWNLQPLPAEVNNYKRAQHPLKFFESDVGQRFVREYDFLPPLDDDAWDDESAFMSYRRQRMIEALDQYYGLRLT